MIDSPDRHDEALAGDLMRVVGAGALVCLAAVWLFAALSGAWIAYDQCNLPNDNGVVCDKTLDYRLSIFQPLLAVPGSLAAMTASHRLPRRTRQPRAAPGPRFPLGVAVLFLILWVAALVVT